MKALAGVGLQGGADGGFNEFFRPDGAVPAHFTTLNADGSAEALAVAIAHSGGLLNVQHNFRNETKGGSPEVRARETLHWLTKKRLNDRIGVWSYAGGSEHFPHPLVHTVTLMNEHNLAGEHNPIWPGVKSYGAYERSDIEITEQIEWWERVLPEAGLDPNDFPLCASAPSPGGDPNDPGSASPQYRAALEEFWGFIPAGHSAEFRLMFRSYKAFMDRGWRIHLHHYLYREGIDRIDYGQVGDRNNLKPVGYWGEHGGYHTEPGDGAVKNPGWWTSANRFIDETVPVLNDLATKLGHPKYANFGIKEYNTGGDHNNNTPAGVAQNFKPFLDAIQEVNDMGHIQFAHVDWFLAYGPKDGGHYFLSILPNRPWIIDEMRAKNGVAWVLPPAVVAVGAPVPPIPAPPSPPPPEPEPVPPGPPDGPPPDFDPNPLRLPVGSGIWEMGQQYRKRFISGEFDWHAVRRADFNGTDDAPGAGYITWHTGLGPEVYISAKAARLPEEMRPTLPEPHVNPVPVMPRQAQHVVDMSNLSRYSMDPEEAACMMEEHNYDGVVVGIHPDQPEIAKHQLLTAAAGGLSWLQVYGDPINAGGRRMADVVAIASKVARDAGLTIGRYWIDYEPAPQYGYKPSEDRLNEAIAACKAAGVPYGIYTGAWAWDLGSRFSWVPLWWASYTGSDTPPASMDELGHISNPYAAWPREMVLGWQWRGTHNLCGVSVDANLFER